jgi:hypothetical protein
MDITQCGSLRTDVSEERIAYSYHPDDGGDMFHRNFDS